MVASTGLIIGSIIAAVLGLTGSAIGTAANYDLTKKTNQANIDAQNAVNQANIDYSKEFAQNGIQWKMQDLQNAGLNPVLAAQGAFGGSSQPTAMSAPVQKTPLIDLGGISSAITALNNSMLTAALLRQRGDIASDYQKVSRQNNADRNEVLKALYQRKGAYMNNATELGNKYVHNAKQINKVLKDDGEWEKILEELNKIPYKYK